MPKQWWLGLSKGDGHLSGPCQAPRPGRGEPHTFVSLQDILVGLEVLLLLHVQVSGWGQVPRHAQVYLSDDWPIPLSRSNPGQDRSQQDAALVMETRKESRLGESAGRRAGGAEPGTQTRGSRARAGRGDAQAPWRAAGAGPPGPQEPQSSQVSAAANLGEPGGGDLQRHAALRSPGPDGDRRRAAGAGTLGGRGGRHPGSALGACSEPGGRARCLRPGCCAAHLRHFLAAAPQTLARAPGRGREGTAGERGGRAERRGRGGGQRPGWLGSGPRRPAPPAGSAAAPGPLSGPPTGPPRGQARPPWTLAGRPGSQGRGFYLGPTTGAWETKPRIAPPARAAPARLPGEEWEILFDPAAVTEGPGRWDSARGESRGSAPLAHLGAGGGPDSLEKPAPARPPPRGPGTSRRSLPSAPQSRPAHLPQPQPESIHSTRLTLSPPSFSLPLFTPHSTGLH